MTSFGENLRRQRELRGIALRDVAEATKIPSRFLAAIEEDRVEILPGGVFRRAFVREYARVVGLDAERTVSEFLFAHPETDADVPRQPQTSRPFPVGAAAVAGVILLGVVLSLARSASPPRAGKEGGVSAPLARTAERVYSPKVEESAATEEHPQGLVLTLSARERCWVSVQVDGRNVLNRELGEGETQTLEAAGEIVLSVGNAGGLAFRVNDHRGMPLGRSGEVKRNIVITRQNLPSLVEDLAPPHQTHS
jgi:cytoskeletal protein RodZ